MERNYKIHKAAGNFSYIVGTFDSLEEAQEHLTDIIHIETQKQGRADHELRYEPSYEALLELIGSYYSIEEDIT